MRTRADADGDGWRITGAKQWITNGRYAGTFILFARDGPGHARRAGVSAFVLDAEHVRSRATRRSSGSTPPPPPTSSSRARRRTRPAAARGGQGFQVAMATLDGGRIGIAAQAVGIAQAAFDVAREYAKERHAFGQPIGGFQAIQHKLAEHVDRDRRRPLLDLPRGAAEGAGRAAHGGGRARRSCSRPRSRAARPARRSRSSAATGTRRSSRSSATTATRRSPRSTRGRARSSASSSPARSSVCNASRARSRSRRACPST